MQNKPKAISDSIHTMVPPERMDPAARKQRDFYAVMPGAPFLKREF